MNKMNTDTTAKIRLKRLKFFFIRTGGIIISLLSLIWMPWSIRVKWAHFVYKISYINPSKFPTYMNFLEETNYKYGMGKSEIGMYTNIFNAKQKYNNSSNPTLLGDVDVQK